MLGTSRQRLDDRAERLLLALPNYVAARRATLERLANRLIHPREFLLRSRNQIDLLAHRLEAPLPNRVREAQLRLENLSSRHGGALPGYSAERRSTLERLANRLIHPREFLLRQRNQIAVLSHRLDGPPASQLREARLRLENLSARLQSLSYEAVLQRGFVLVTTPKGVPILSAAKIKPGDALNLKFHDGNVAAKAAPQQQSLDL